MGSNMMGNNDNIACNYTYKTNFHSYTVQYIVHYMAKSVDGWPSQTTHIHL